jgi:hypothetical protein
MLGHQKSKRLTWNVLASLLAGGIPMFVILYALKGIDIAALPRALTPTGDTYSDGIALVSSTSGTLVTIALAILGAEAVWLVKEAPAGLISRTLAYAVFCACIISLYLGIKVGSWAGLALASSEPNIVPLLGFLEWQALLVLFAGLVLSALALFSFLEANNQ